MFVSGRKYGLGKYGAGTYDLGVPKGIPPWIPIPVDPAEIWMPTIDGPPWCEQPPPVNVAEIWKPVLMPVSSDG